MKLLAYIAIGLMLIPPAPDPASIGTITLYDKAGAVVTGGSITDKPFVWRAVSSVKAPAPYDGTGRKATLAAFQPRPGTPPDQWSGDTMTASVAYTDKPIVQATDTDFTLKDFLDGFPTQVDGLVQLRILFGAPGNPTLTNKYSTLDIRVTGDRWAIVGSTSDTASPLPNVSGVTQDPPGESTTTELLSGVLPALGTPGVLIIAAIVLVAIVGAGAVRRRRKQ